MRGFQVSVTIMGSAFSPNTQKAAYEKFGNPIDITVFSVSKLSKAIPVILVNITRTTYVINFESNDPSFNIATKVDTGCTCLAGQQK